MKKDPKPLINRCINSFWEGKAIPTNNKTPYNTLCKFPYIIEIIENIRYFLKYYVDRTPKKIFILPIMSFIFNQF